MDLVDRRAYKYEPPMRDSCLNASVSLDAYTFTSQKDKPLAKMAPRLFEALLLPNLNVRHTKSLKFDSLRSSIDFLNFRVRMLQTV